jgi:shikimate kinase
MIYFLIGFMGAGKSTCAAELSQRTGVAYVDLDKEIERVQNQAIQDIFNEKGEEFFRELEAKVLRSIQPQEEDLIVACGGGTPCFHDSMKWMNEQGETWYLKISPSEIYRRIDPEQWANRPVLKGARPEEVKRFIQDLMMTREKFYLQAHKVISEENANARYLERYIVPEFRPPLDADASFK